MGIFKTVDEKFKEIGFEKIAENEYGATYEKIIQEHDYVHVIHLGRKRSGFHLIQSYDKGLYDEKYTGNVGVGLTMYETKLCLKKMKQMGWQVKKVKKDG